MIRGLSGAINKIGSVFYGPILGVFLLAAMTQKTHARGVNIALVTSVLFNIYLWKMQPQIFWFWWNVIGCLLTVSLGVLLSYLIPSGKKSDPPTTAPIAASYQWNIPEAYVLLAFFVIIWAFSSYLPALFH